MPGPCSLPNGGKKEWNNMNEVICNFHANKDEVCTPIQPKVGKDDKELVHDFVTRRLWLLKRNRLTTGKTV